MLTRTKTIPQLQDELKFAQFTMRRILRRLARSKTNVDRVVLTDKLDNIYDQIDQLQKQLNAGGAS